MNAISCTPSYPALLAKVLREETDLEPRDLGLRIALFGGEAGLDNADFRARARGDLGLRGRATRTSACPRCCRSSARSASETTDLHFHAGDAVFAEIIDPRHAASGCRSPRARPASWSARTSRASASRSCATAAATPSRSPAPARAPAAARRGGSAIAGRTDDMFNVRGVNVFPTAVRAVVAGLPELLSGPPADRPARARAVRPHRAARRGRRRGCRTDGSHGGEGRARGAR